VPHWYRKSTSAPAYRPHKQPLKNLCEPTTIINCEHKEESHSSPKEKIIPSYSKTLETFTLATWLLINNHTVHLAGWPHGS